MITEEHVRHIHQKATVIDAHFDLLMDVEVQRQQGRKKVIETDYLPNFASGGVDIIVASIFIESSFLPEMGLRKALAQIEALYEEVAESKETIMLCKTADDVHKAKQEGKIGFILSFEGVEPIGNDLRLLRIFYELGVRIVGLTWSRRNEVGDGAHFSPVREGKKGGLTAFGIELIEAAESLGMFIDVTHINDEGFWDVMDVVKKPVIASHSNARALVGTARNLTDEQIQAIAAKDGVIGMNAANFIVAEEDEKANVEGMIDHVDHIVKLVGIRHVGIGLDLCDDFMKYVSSAELAKMARKPFDSVAGHKCLPELSEGLAKRGYCETDIEQILGKNFIRVYGEAWG